MDMKKFPPPDENVQDVEYWRKWFKIISDQNLELVKENKELKRENEQLRNSMLTFMSEANYYKMTKNNL